MNRHIAHFLFLAAILGMVSPAAALDQLGQLKWQNRIILLQESGSSGKELLEKHVEQIDERHIIWFRLSGEELSSNYPEKINEEFKQKLIEEYFDTYSQSVFLIGKDGMIKSMDEKLDLEMYFRLIDAMPMRQQEMKSQRGE